MTENEIELSARLSAQRFLLEIVFTNAFAANASGFQALMDELLRLTRVSTTTSAPISNEVEREAVMEMQARTAAHLERFASSVIARIESGRSI